MMTLFTKSPLPSRINRQLVERFGRPTDKGKKVLYTTINAISKNTLYALRSQERLIEHTSDRFD